MKMELPEIRPEERTPLVEALLGIIRELLDRNRQLEETVQQLRDEIAVLKGQKPRPNIKPSRLESDTPPSQSETSQKKEGKRPGSEKRSKNSELKIHETVPLRIDNLPPGAVLKGYERFVVQDLEIKGKNTLYLRARYQLPDGGSVLAPLPAGVTSHYGPEVTAYILHQYYACHVTQPLLLQELHDFGVDISAGQLSRILTEGKDIFHQEKEDMLATALVVSAYIGTDDTGARHQGHNGYCTAVGNDLFSYFASTSSKSRLNFLEVLQGPQRDYAINEMAVIYWKRPKLAAAVVEKLQHGPQEFAGETAWQARLKELAIEDERHVRLATEGALLGGLVARGVSPDLGVLSDGAPQFVIFVHAACWIHAERPLARLVPHNEEHRLAIEQVRDSIWKLYKDLKSYRQQPIPAEKLTLETRFDTLCDHKSGYPSIDGVLKEMREHKADLLRVLERPELPLHNNGMESDIREYVKKRKVSGGTRSDDGRRCRDTFTSLKKTCRKLAVNFLNYVKDRIRGVAEIPRLSDLIRQRASESSPPSGEAVPV